MSLDNDYQSVNNLVALQEAGIDASASTSLVLRSDNLTKAVEIARYRIGYLHSGD